MTRPEWITKYQTERVLIEVSTAHVKGYIAVYQTSSPAGHTIVSYSPLPGTELEIWEIEVGETGSTQYKTLERLDWEEP